MRSFKKLAAILMLVSFIFATVSPAMALTDYSPLEKITNIAGENGGNARGNSSTIYFGTYWQTLKSGATSGSTNLSDYNKDGIKWRVLSNDDGKTFLMSDQALYADAFQSDSSTNVWKDSEIRATMKNETATTFNADGTVQTWGGFAGDAFSDKEYAAIAETTHKAGGREEYPGYDTVSTDKIFLLSDEEVNNTAYGFEETALLYTPSDTRKASATDMAAHVKMYNNTAAAYVFNGYSCWWLRSPGNTGSGAYDVYTNGNVAAGDDVAYDDYAARAALNLNQDKVLFLSAAKDGKGAVAVGGGFALNTSYAGADGWKLTMTDTSIAKPNVTQAEIVGKTWDVNDLAETAKSGTKIIEISDQTPTGDEGLKIAYNGAATGTNMFVSALLKDGSGNYVNYAKVSNLAADTKIIDVSGITAADYTLCIYGEQENGDYQTDYASALSEHAITIPTDIPETVNKILSRDYAAEGLEAKISNDCELGFEAGEYDTAVTIEDGKSGKITADPTNGTILTGAVTVKENATLTTANKFTLKGDSMVEGTLNFGGGSIEADVIGDNGTTNINGDTENKGAISQKEVTVAKGKRLTNKGTVHAGTLKAQGAKIINCADSDEGEVDIEANTINAEGGVIENYADIEAVNFNGGNDGKLVNGETGEIEIDNITGIVDNKGKVKFVNAEGNSFNGVFTNRGTLKVINKVDFTGKLDTKGGTLVFDLDGHKAGDVFINNDTTADLTGAKIELLQTDEGNKLKDESETMTLVSKAEKYDGAAEIETQDGAHKYKYGVGIDENSSLMLQYRDQGVADQTKSFSEARLAGSAAINSASDLVAGQAIDSASSSGSWEAFAAMGGSHSRYETGSHIDLNSTNVAAGLSKKIKDNVTLGLFVEGGNGRYTTENEFEDGNVRADGDINYFGGGIFAKVEGKKIAKGQLHGEASFRAGHMNSDYNSETFMPGESTRFDTSNAYMGAHAGLGYKWNVTNGGNIDTYVKYLWNRQNSDSPTIDGEQFDLDAINSHRLRAGFRYNGKETKEGIKFFGGLAYEYEFDGAAKGHMGEYSLLEPDFKGGSGMAELGIKYHKANSPWKVELGVTGYTGKRDSIGANLGAWYEFGK